jgi:hypothetical protein
MSIEYESSVSTGLHKETVQARVNYAGLITLNVEGFGVTACHRAKQVLSLQDKTSKARSAKLFDGSVLPQSLEPWQ